MTELIEEFEKTFSNESVSSLAEIWVFLNHSGEMCNHDSIWSIMAHISDKITMKECLRCWNTVDRTDDGKMTNEAFEAWWDTRYE